MASTTDVEPGALPFASYVDAIGEEAERLAQAARRGLELAVPSCPGWSVRDLVDHVSGVYRFWTMQLEARHPESRTEVVDPGRSDVLETFDTEVVRLVAALSAAGPASPSWNWSGSDLVAAWVARRMALESAVHRVDGELAIGAPLPVERELAVDGIDERIGLHLVIDAADDPAMTLGGSICLVCSDDVAAWVVELSGGRVRWRRGRGPADVVVVGRASDLFLFTWNRIGLDGLEMTGRRDIAERWRELRI